ncbi:MAG: hypothetical protein WCI55_06125 [Armatimonadota bacterium]
MKKSGIIIAALLAFASLAYGDTVGKAVTLKTKLITRTTAQLMAYDKIHGPKLPIRKIKGLEEEHEYYRTNLPSNPGSPAVAEWPIRQNDVAVNPVPTPKRKDIGPLFGVPVSFAGPDLPSGGFIPPDSTGDVSKTSVIVAANDRLRSYDRLGNLTTMNLTNTAFFSPLTPTGGTSDPRVVYDRLSDRWFIEIIDLASTNNKILLAVSDNGNITGSTVWRFFSFAQNIGGGTSGFADYCTLGVDANGVYMGSNRFGGSFANCDVFAVNKAQLLQAVPVLTVTPFRNMCTSASGTGMFTPWPCTNDDPAATSCLVIGVDNAAFSLLSWRRISFSAGTFSISANSTLSLPTTASPLPMQSNPSTHPLDSLDDRIFNARVFRNRLTGDVTVHAAHGIRMGSTGVGSAAGDRTGARWYNFGNVFSGALTLTASGTVVDAAATPPNFCSIPSTAMNGQGHQFIGFSMGRTLNPAGVGGAYRNAGDPNVSAPTLIQAGGPSYAVQAAGTQRWGDYSVTCVDPRDMMSMWSFQEFINTTNSWQVRGIKVLAPAPTVTTLTPNNANQGDTLNVVVTGTGIFDPDATYPDHLAFNFGANITVNSVTWTNATTATANITIGGAAATGARTITMTNPDGQTANGTFTVNTGAKLVSGVLTLQGYLGTSPLIAGSQFIFEIRDAGTNALIETDPGTTTAGHAFSFSTSLPAGTYKLRIKGVNRFLAKSQTLTLTATGATGLAYTLTNGDVNGDNVVGAADFNLFRAAFGGSSVSSDFNGDGVVGTADFNILRTSLGQAGDN